MGCPFCEIVSGEKSCYVVYEDNHTLAFLDAHPITEGHTLVIPKKHYSQLDDLPDDVLACLFKTVKFLVSKMRSALDLDGIHIGVNCGEAANQLVPHLHVHLIPRRSNVEITWNMRIVPRPGELRFIQEKLRVHIKESRKASSDS